MSNKIKMGLDAFTQLSEGKNNREHILGANCLDTDRKWSL